MRFFVSPELKGNKPLFHAVLWFLAYAFIFWVANWFYYHYKFGLLPGETYRYFFLDPAFPQPISAATFFEDLHIYFFLVVMFLLVVCSLLARTGLPEKIKSWLILLAFLSALFEAGTSFLILFVSPLFAYVKLALFFLFQATCLVMLLAIAVSLWKGPGAPERGALRAILFLFGFAGLLYAAGNVGLFAGKIGWTPDAIRGYYLGDPDKFLNPKTLRGLTVLLHPHWLAMPIFIVALAHFLIFTGVRPAGLLLGLSLSSALADNLAGFLVRFVAPFFWVVKAGAFLLLQASLFAAAGLLVLHALKEE